MEFLQTEADDLRLQHIHLRNRFDFNVVGLCHAYSLPLAPNTPPRISTLMT